MAVLTDEVIKNLIDDVNRREPDGCAILLSLVGSHAYGLATEDSDFDFIGVYAPSAHDALVGTPTETLTSHREDFDYTFHVVNKFIALAAKGNPTVLEALWLPPLAIAPLGAAIIELRDVFVTQRALHQYRGYASGQLARLKNSVGVENHGAPIPPQYQKLARHMMRILEQGITLSETGEVVARVKDPEALFRFAKGTVHEVEEAFEERFKALVVNPEFPLDADVSQMLDVVFQYYVDEMRDRG